MTLDKMDGRGLINTVCRKHLPRRLGVVVLANKGTLDNSSKTEHFSYKAELADV